MHLTSAHRRGDTLTKVNKTQPELIKGRQTIRTGLGGEKNRTEEV